MHRVSHLRALLVVAALLAATLVGCVSQSDPDSVAQAWAHAVFSNDIETARKLADRPDLTTGDLENLKASQGLFGETAVRTITVVESGGSGDTRTVTLALAIEGAPEDVMFPVKLQLREGKWFVNTAVSKSP